MTKPIDISFCGCGLRRGHKEKCLSIKMEHKEHQEKYSGKSKSENAFNDYR